VGKDSITGLLLAGIGHVNQQSKKNFLTVEASESLSTLTGTRIADGRTETPTTVIEAAFQEFTERPDIAILLINQHVSLTP
jgi:V-type H+-transporting ATPase subunit F